MNTQKSLYHRHRFPPNIIQHAVWLYNRFSLSFQDIEDLLAERGVTVSYETIRRSCTKFDPRYATQLRRRYGRHGDTWHVDEVFVRIRGKQDYLYRAIDQDGDVIDILIQNRCDTNAAVRFFNKLMRGQGGGPRRLVTDKLKSYPAARRRIMPDVVHVTDRYANNRAEVSHETTRQRERIMRRFKSVSQPQRFLTVHGMVQNLFRFGRHLLRARNYRLFRMRAFARWQQATCV
jgi:putative transposase